MPSSNTHETERSTGNKEKSGDRSVQKFSIRAWLLDMVNAMTIHRGRAMVSV